jgi:hypothetical protein
MPGNGIVKKVMPGDGIQKKVMPGDGNSGESHAG